MIKIDKVYTKRGDGGSTILSKKKILKKNDILIEVLGSLDELNCFIGLAKVSLKNKKKFHELVVDLQVIQNLIFEIGRELINKKENKYLITLKDVKDIEKKIDSLNLSLKPLKSFVIPGSGTSNAYLHIARTICRTLERRMITLSLQQKINKTVLMYVNRLSDLLFVFARFVTHSSKEKEVLWKQKV